MRFLMANVSEPIEHRLEGLLSVTDSALTGLKVEDLLVELLNRVREVLEADTAAVLLMDRDANELVATAACGIEDEVRQGVRIPVGHGFAGRIAEQRQPVSLTRVDPTTVTNPILWEKGIRVMLGVPLITEDQVLGVLHVGRLDDRPFTSSDSELLRVVAERVAGATQTRLLAVERAAASLLERSLLPSRLPLCPGLELAARYLTPQERSVGGDWYDLFVLPSGDLWVVTGDVAGHGLPAAVVMGRVRSALRAYALVSDSPEAAMELTDRKVLHFEMGTMVTVVCATSAPPYRTFRIASAGHLPPVVAVPDGPAWLVELPLGEPLGIRPGVRRSSTTVELPDGAAMLLYTDGLVERRDEPLDESLERLRTHFRPQAPHLACRDLLRTFLGSRPPTDDVAIVAIRRGAEPEAKAAAVTATASSESVTRYSAEFTDEVESVARARHWVSGVLAENGQSSRADTVCLLVSELATNSLRHAHSPFEVTVLVDGTDLLVEVMDHSRQLPVKAGPRDDFGGKGLLFMDTLADAWGSRLVPGGKIVFFTLDLQPASRSEQ
jgi:phosphoserine phosphatase RsbU/P